MKLLMFVAAAGLAGAAFAEGELTITTIPGEYVLVHDINGRKGYTDLMLQTILLRNEGAEPLTVSSMTISVEDQGGGKVRRELTAGQLVAQTAPFAGFAKRGPQFFVNAQVLDADGLSGALDPRAAFAGSEVLEPGQLLLANAQYLAVGQTPISAAITVSFRNAAGIQQTATQSLAVRRWSSAITYRAPVSGPWLVRSAPSIESHHRFIPSNEFALDFFKTGADGALDRGSRGAEDDYGHGAPVMAVADGKVVFVISDQVQDSDALSRREGETVDEARHRITQIQMQRFAKDFRAAAAGNMVTIAHKSGAVVEYSSYAHLQAGSVRVSVGDEVEGGQVIAAVGNTGDSTLTHLHFQLNTGPDAFFSRSLPVRFSNEKSRYIGQEPGLFYEFQ